MADLLPILVACEYSDTVASAFRAFGFDAYSCDLRPSEGDQRWHIQDDVRNHLQAGRWLAMVAHADYATTEKYYAHLTPEDDDGAVAKLKY